MFGGFPVQEAGIFQDAQVLDSDVDVSVHQRCSFGGGESPSVGQQFQKFQPDWMSEHGEQRPRVDAWYFNGGRCGRRGVRCTVGIHARENFMGRCSLQLELPDKNHRDRHARLGRRPLLNGEPSS
jgi:hypothetical protein